MLSCARPKHAARTHALNKACQVSPFRLCPMSRVRARRAGRHTHESGRAVQSFWEILRCARVRRAGRGGVCVRRRAAHAAGRGRRVSGGRRRGGRPVAGGRGAVRAAAGAVGALLCGGLVIGASRPDSVKNFLLLQHGLNELMTLIQWVANSRRVKQCYLLARYLSLKTEEIFEKRRRDWLTRRSMLFRSGNFPLVVLGIFVWRMPGASVSVQLGSSSANGGSLGDARLFQ
jgi:hypothetical protein